MSISRIPPVMRLINALAPHLSCAEFKMMETRVTKPYAKNMSATAGRKFLAVGHVERPISGGDEKGPNRQMLAAEKRVWAWHGSTSLPAS